MAVPEATLQPDLTTLQSDIQQLREDFAKMTSDMRSYAGNGLSSASEQAQVSAEKMWGEVKRQAQQVGHEIEERPLTSALAAFSTGLILGMILNARRG
ncbi:MAG TPA: hypothetical protein VHW66_10760 [Stellaceae bacterium]|jgi:ElaB/YqjD/DUF883 family membrane-anchored ribosome-binding protein|nr:hypothetical protein [Stellaceae bacterium]